LRNNEGSTSIKQLSRNQRECRLANPTFRRRDRNGFRHLLIVSRKARRLPHGMGELSIDPYEGALTMSFDGSQERLYEHVSLFKKTTKYVGSLD
jgi:hypothetical protein